MERKPFETLARLVQTLAAGRPVETTFVMGQRQTEWKETFLVGQDRIDRTDSVMHVMTTRKGGVERRQLEEVTDWGLDGILKWVVELDDADLATVESQLLEADLLGPTAQAIADMADATGVVTVIAGIHWTRPDDAPAITSANGTQWTFDQTVMAVRAGR